MLSLARAFIWLQEIASKDRSLFYHWQRGQPPDYVYAQSIECEEPCEGRLSRTVPWEGEGEAPSLYSTLSFDGWGQQEKEWFPEGRGEAGWDRRGLAGASYEWVWCLWYAVHRLREIPATWCFCFRCRRCNVENTFHLPSFSDKYLSILRRFLTFAFVND